MKKPTLEQLKRVPTIGNYYKYQRQECAYSFDCKKRPDLYYILVEREEYTILVFCFCKEHINTYVAEYTKRELENHKISPLQRFDEKELFTIQIL